MHSKKFGTITWSKILFKLKSLARFPFVLSDFLRFKRSMTDQRFSLSVLDSQPCLGDNIATVEPERHYTYHPAWAARILAETRPAKHIDISSALDFSTLVSAFIPMEFYDLRPALVNLDNLKCGQADLVRLPFKDGEIKSLSCMHVMEHVGLGRYGDPIDYNGDLKGMKELERVLAPGGNLLFVVPMGGNPRIQFNAHRIYTYDQIISYFSGLKLKEFAMIPDRHESGDLVRHASRELANAQRHGCGCFWFVKES